MSNRTNEIAKGEHPRQRTPLEPVDNLIKDEIAKVNALDDICEAIDICEANQIPYDGLNDIEDFKERIRLHFRKKWNLESRKTEVCFLHIFVVILHKKQHLFDFNKQNKSLAYRTIRDFRRI